MSQPPSDPRPQDRVQTFSVVNAGYMRLALAWGLQVRKVSAAEPRFVCADAASADFLGRKGFACETKLPPQDFSRHDKTVFAESSFPTDAAAYAASLKMAAAVEMLAQGQSIVFSDVDAIWLKDPMADLTGTGADIVFQPGSFPFDVKQAWGITLCTGLFYMRANAATVALARSVRDRFDGSDQRTLNMILLEDYDIAWDSHPKDWETCAPEASATTALHGVCGRTGLRLTALPHAYYQRHNTSRAACAHAVVCHPNSPKNEAGKFEVLQALGLLTDG